jgi:hypothetical protein
MFNNYYFIFGAIIIAAGFQGFLKGSKASLIAALILGGLVIAGTILGGTIGSILALVGSLGIAGKFLPAFLKAKDKGAALWPAGVLGIMAVVALVMIIRGLTGI